MIWAGRAWATGSLCTGKPAHAEAIEDAALWGIDLSDDELEPDVGAVWAEHVPAVEAFLVCQTQWRWVPRYGARDRAAGLDYAGCDVALRHAGIEVTPELWEQFRVIELAAKAALNEG
ncbi:MAG: DUF1799 domain-containing protein [Marinovum algicola]|uniref:DUF1799 domain-containing protein n=1 Tax=Marinovum algicola TaxID=42444 RepID=UPI0032EDA252